MHGTTAWHWPAIPTSDLISLSSTATSPTPTPTLTPTSTYGIPTSTLEVSIFGPEIPTPISTSSAVTPGDGVPLAQKVDGQGGDLQDGAEAEIKDSEPTPEPESEGVPAAEVGGETSAEATDTAMDTAAGADVGGDQVGTGSDRNGTALAMGGSSEKLGSNGSIRNVSSKKYLVRWSIICLVASQFM